MPQTLDLGELERRLPLKLHFIIDGKWIEPWSVTANQEMSAHLMHVGFGTYLSNRAFGFRSLNNKIWCRVRGIATNRPLEGYEIKIME